MGSNRVGYVEGGGGGDHQSRYHRDHRRPSAVTSGSHHGSDGSISVGTRWWWGISWPGVRAPLAEPVDGAAVEQRRGCRTSLRILRRLWVHGGGGGAGANVSLQYPPAIHTLKIWFTAAVQSPTTISTTFWVEKDAERKMAKNIGPRRRGEEGGSEVGRRVRIGD